MFRHPHTQNERKANLHHIQESRIEGYPLPVRLKRHILPSDWDDLYPATSITSRGRKTARLSTSTRRHIAKDGRLNYKHCQPTGQNMSVAKSYRAWINQPSTLQPHHNLHGKRVIVIPSESQFDETVHVFFADNDDFISMEILPICLSDGWPKHL